MKLFGGKHNSRHTGGRAAPKRETGGERAASGKPRSGLSRYWWKLSGLQRGLILLLGSILVLVGVVVGVYKALVRPPDIQKPSLRQEESGEPEVDEAGNPVPRPSRPRFTYTDDDGNEVDVEFDAPGAHMDGRYNILLVGTDGDGTRTDTIMIAHMDTIDHEVALMSVPRDTLIYGNYSVPKINSVYGGAGKGEKGIRALEEQLASILGFEVDGYVMVDLEAFVKIIDIVGGVPFDVPQRMYYNDPTQNLHIDLYAGEQVLDGQHAMQLVRFRSWAPGDIKRTETQRDFLKALAGELLSLKTITKIKPIIETCVEYVDTDLTLGNILYFAQEMLSCDLSEMVSVSLPGDNTWVAGASCWYLYAKQVLEIVNENFNPYDTDIALSSLHIRTGGGSGGSGSSRPGSTPAPSAAPAPSPEPEPPEDPDTPSGTGVLDPGTTDPEDPSGPDAPGDPDNPNEPGTDVPADPNGSGGTETPGSSGEPGTSTDPDPAGDPGEPAAPADPPADPAPGDANGAGLLDPGTAETGGT